MKKNLKKLENKNMQLTMEFDHTEWENLLENAYNKTKGKYKLEGFRQGKAPRKMIEKAYGSQVFFQDAISDGFNEHYVEILENDKSFEPIDGPDISVEKFDESGITIVAEIPVKPEIKMGEYKNLKINVAPKEITEKDIEEELKRVQLQNTRFVEKEGVAEIGNIANIDFKGSVDGEYFEGGTAEGFDLELGSKSFIDNFEDQLVGSKAGDEKDVLVTFPENYQADNLAGKQAKFEVKVNTIKFKELPEINDELASNVSEFETLAEYKEHIKAHLQEHATKDAKVKTENEILDKIVENMTVEVPDIMVSREQDAIMQDLEYRLMYQGMNLETYTKYMGTNVSELREQKKNDAHKSVKIRMALGEILKAEKIDVNDSDVENYVEKMASKANKSVDEYKATLTEERLSYIHNEILMNRLLEFLVENNK